mmetsp:Transcript_91969/g.268986  ORF Transcript_91969/g.268986 Transcript_91969/m.268986 type:complete len:311 (+) Transcript_91969:88-1020(+)
MAPHLDALSEDLFECGICKELLLDPVTLSCCGKSFCQGCLRDLLLSVAETGVARCPAGCGRVVPFHLPPRSYVLQQCLEAGAAEEIARRRAAEESEVAALPGDFEAWEEVAASQDLTIRERIVVAYGTPGVLLGSRREGRLEVVFDERTDFRHGSLHVQPFELLRQLPSHFGVRIGQRVVAVVELGNASQGTVFARVGAHGTALRRHGEDRLVVQMEETREDGSDLPLRVHYSEVMPSRTLLGGYRVGQHVQASLDLYQNETLLMRAGTTGVVHGEYSDVRLTVQFDGSADGSPRRLNVTVPEIQPLEPH